MLTNPAGTNDVTHDIIGCGIKVHRALGPGLLESAYAACLALELVESGHAVEVRKAVPLVYRSVTLDVAFAHGLLTRRPTFPSSCVPVRLRFSVLNPLSSSPPVEPSNGWRSFSIAPGGCSMGVSARNRAPPT